MLKADQFSPETSPPCLIMFALKMVFNTTSSLRHLSCGKVLPILNFGLCEMPRNNSCCPTLTKMKCHNHVENPALSPLALVNILLYFAMIFHMDFLVLGEACYEWPSWVIPPRRPAWFDDFDVLMSMLLVFGLWVHVKDDESIYAISMSFCNVKIQRSKCF